MCWNWKTKGPQNPAVAEGTDGTLQFFTDLCHVQTARAAGEVGRICAELVFGYNRHPGVGLDACRGCYHADELDALESRDAGHCQRGGVTDVVESDGSHPAKAGPCARFDGLEQFHALAAALGWLPHRIATGEGSRGGSAHARHDSGGAGLSGMSERPRAGSRYRVRGLRPGDGRIFDHPVAVGPVAFGHLL